MLACRVRRLIRLLAVMCASLGCFALAAPPAIASPHSHAYRISLKAPGQAPVALYAEEHGRGRPILMLHGLAASSYTWRKLVPGLSRSHRVITLDLKGFGRSEKPFDLAYSPHHHAALVTAFIRKRGLRDVTLVGHSFGGAVALLVALDLGRSDPSRIRDLVLMNAPAYNQPKTQFVDFMRAPVLPYAVLTLVPPEISTWLALDDQQAAHLTPSDVRAYARPFYEAGARHALIATSRSIIPPDVESITRQYRNIRQRTLVIWCDGDRTVPLSTGIRLSQAIPRARLEVLKGCGHVPPDEQPKAVLAAMKRFLH